MTPSQFDLYELAVFTNEAGEYGNPLGVLTVTDAISDDDAQRIAAELGYSETIFFADDWASIRIYTPALRLPFAGHPTVGACWFLQRQGRAGDSLKVDAGVIGLEPGPEMCTIEAEAAWSPVRHVEQLDSAAEVEAAPVQTTGRSTYVWAWIDEAAGTVRSRCFVSNLGVAEDEATGSAAVYLADHLGRKLEITQGKGSRIVVEPTDHGTVRLSGRVRETRRGTLTLGDGIQISWDSDAQG